MIDWANENAGLFSLVFTAVVAASAVVTAWFTSRLAQETVRLRKVETDPNIAVYLAAGEGTIGVFYLVVRNIGNGAAYGVSFDVKVETNPSYDQYMGAMRILRDGIKYLAPNEELRSFVGRYEQLEKAPSTITVTYKGKPGRPQVPFVETFTIDVRMFAGVRPPHGLLEKQTEAIEQVSKDLARYLRTQSGARASASGVRLPLDVPTPAHASPHLSLRILINEGLDRLRTAVRNW